MDWYFVNGEQQSGPFTKSQFDECVKTGQVTPETLVWHEGMTDWQPFRSVSQQATVGHASAQTCIACGRSHDKGDLLQLDEGPICAACKPLYTQRLKEGLRPVIDVQGSGGVWRESKHVLVMDREAQLPYRCVKCNKTAETTWTKKLSYNHPAVFLLILINLLILLIVAVLTAKRAVVDIPLCEHHRARIKSGIILAWSCFAGALVLAGVAVLQEMESLALLAIISLMVSMLVGITRGRLVYARKIDKEHVWLKGVCHEYLDELPKA